MVSTDLRKLHSSHSSLREKIVEHQFIGLVLKSFWRQGNVNVEILKSEFDAGGYDLVLSWGKIVRHIQLKAVLFDGKTSDVSVNLNLASRPSGCVVWIDVNEELDIKGFRWFGADVGSPLPGIFDNAVTKHTKGNSEGKKNNRENHRTVSKKAFEKLISIDGLLERLVGGHEKSGFSN